MVKSLFMLGIYKRIISFRSIFKNGFLIIFFLVSCLMNMRGQEGIKISKPQLRFVKDSLIIDYSILSGNPADKFNVQLRISDSSGTLINAKSLSGDIGDSIGTGSDKTIVWNLAEDKIYINTGIFIEVKAKKIVMPVVVPVQKKEEAIAEKKSKEDDVSVKKKKTIPVTESKEKTVQSAEIVKNLLLSAVIPGWGLTRLSDGKPYWIIAVVDVGCLAASIYYNKKASSNYTNYLNSSDATEFDPYFEDASTQNTLSKVFAWSAVGIWVADMCLVGIKAINVDKSLKNNKTSYLRIGSYFDYNTSTACLSINFNF